MFLSNTVLIVALFAHNPRNMPPLTNTNERHSSDYGVRQNHPTSYDDNPPFKGPLRLKDMCSPEYHRRRIRGYYLDDEMLRQTLTEGKTGDVSSPKLSASSSTSNILKAIVDHLARSDAPVDAKEVAESLEFYLRTGKRLLGAAKRVLKNRKANGDDVDMDTITIRDFCCGHGLTGQLFVACNPPGKTASHVRAVLVDQFQPQSHAVLRDIISEVCPWVSEESVIFVSSPLEDYASTAVDSRDNDASIVISTHACGSLTDGVIQIAIDSQAVALACMPCCYTGTADGAPFGVKRMLGVGLAADVRRSFILQSHAYHVDFATIPKAITPMNRLIVAERRS
eukprot:scaffold808_cov196-Alexandrium_tamarense.AAC.106